MLKYSNHLKSFSRRLRRDMTDAEQLLWLRIRRKQILDVQFNRQRPIGDYVADFYAPKAKLIVEIDGGQHLEANAVIKDKQRDEFFNGRGLKVLRFDNFQVLQQIDAVVDEIYREVESRIYF